MATGETFDRPTLRVQRKQYWGDPWEEAEYWVPLRATN